MPVHGHSPLVVNMANVTLLRRDSYLKAGIKSDILAALRTAPLHIPTLFPDSVIKQAEEDSASFDKGRSGSVYKKGRYHPYERPESKPDNRKQDRLAWKNLSHDHNKRSKGSVKPVTNVQNVASNLPVGARLQNFWQMWMDLGAGPKVVQMLKEGYTLPFQTWSNLKDFPPS